MEDDKLSRTILLVARITICLSSGVSFVSTTYLISKLVYNKGYQ